MLKKFLVISTILLLSGCMCPFWGPGPHHGHHRFAMAQSSLSSTSISSEIQL